MSDQSNNYSCGILFVDDEEKARKYFERAFKRDYDVLTAESVAHARNILSTRGDEIGVLITDQRMPNEQGVDLLAFVRAEYPHIIRILTTAYSDIDEAIAAVNSGEILRYISKPWDLAELTADLRHAVQFFRIQQERNQLLAEKIGVKQRISAVNQARDLIIMSACLSQFNNSREAMRSLLSQAIITNKHDVSSGRKDLWDQCEKEIHITLDLIEEVKQIIIPLSDDIESVDICVLVQQMAEENTAVIFDNELQHHPHIECSPLTIVRILDLLLNQIKEVEDSPITISLGEEEGLAKVGFKSEQSPGEQRIIVSVELIAAFLLSYHIGGRISLLCDDGQVEMNLFLAEANRDQKVIHPETQAYWMDSIFCQYEH